jgi:hypothetical protein
MAPSAAREPARHRDSQDQQRHHERPDQRQVMPDIEQLLGTDAEPVYERGPEFDSEHCADSLAATNTGQRRLPEDADRDDPPPSSSPFS